MHDAQSTLLTSDVFESTSPSPISNVFRLVIDFGPICCIIRPLILHTPIPSTLLHVYVIPASCLIASSTMSADEDQRPYDSRTYRTSNNLVLHSSVPNELHQSAYLSSTTSDSVQPTIVLPAREFPSQFVTSHTQTDFNLPVRGRYEPQDQARRVSVAGFESQASNGTNPAHNDSASYYSAEDYQQAVAQFHARRSRSQPPKPETGAFFPHHPPPSQAPAAMRFVLFPRPSRHHD